MVNNATINLSIIPASTQKIPFDKWSEFQKKIAPIDGWYNHYLKQGYVGIICGQISGNLEGLDVDVKNDPSKTIFEEYRRLIPDHLFNRLIVVKTHNLGYHIIYSCPEAVIDGNQKLALNENQEVILETRGEGGYLCTNTTDYKVIQGVFDLKNFNVDIPVISPEEREFLLTTARSLTRYYAPQQVSKNGVPFSYSEPAINDFNNKYDGTQLFVKHGWKITNEDADKYFLLREGSSAPHSGYYFKSTNLFYCFSTSTVFTPQKPYNNFQILRLLEGNNDYRTTLNLLPGFGYPVTNVKEKLSPYDIADYLNNVGVRYDEFIQDLTLNGNIIEELDYNTIYIKMKIHFDREVPRPKFEEVIKSRFITAYNPITEFIERNKHRKPEGTFEKWFGCMILENPSIDRKIVLHFLKKWYVGMIAQALGTGEWSNEFFLAILSRIQGIGKSTFLRRSILPDELRCYIAEHSLTFDDDFKVLMGQSLLILDDEMDGRTFESSQTFKNVLSQGKMTTRRKYDRRVSNIKRRCSFAGSGNNLSVIREAQDRRIIPIEVKSFDYKCLNEDIDYKDLFMEAYNLLKSGFNYSYNGADKKDIEHLYNDYYLKSDIELVIDEYFELPIEDNDKRFISTLKIVTRLSELFPHFIKRINPVTIGKLLNDRGYKSTRYGKQKISGYYIHKNSKIMMPETEGDKFPADFVDH